LLDQSIDVFLSVTQITSLNEVLELSSSEATGWVAQFERPQEVRCLLEVRSNSVDLVDQILHADNAELAQGVLDQLVVGQGNSLLFDLSIAPLVDELSNGLEVGVAVGDVGVDDSQHLLRGFGQANENTVVDLEESEKLEDLSRLRGDLVDTLDSDDEDESWLLLNVEAAALSGDTSKSDLLAFLVTVLLDILLGSLEDHSSLLLVGLLPLLNVSISLFSSLLLALSLLQQGLRDEHLVLGWDG